jgi:hypothetical protein
MVSCCVNGCRQKSGKKKNSESVKQEEESNTIDKNKVSFHQLDISIMTAPAP